MCCRAPACPYPPGSSLSLSWALYVLICQRTPEFSPLDDVTEVDEGRSNTALLIILLSLLVLVPNGGPVNPDDIPPGMF